MRKCPVAFFSCKPNLRYAIAADHAQELTIEPWQLRLLKDVEDPGMIDTRIRTSKIS